MPSFKWDEKSTIQEAFLHITFPDGSNGTAELHSNNPIPEAHDDKDMNAVDECILTGLMMDGLEAKVHLNGCPGNTSFTVRFM